MLAGASHGIMVGHVVPEAAVGGPIALVRDGDWVTIDLSSRLLSVELSEFELLFEVCGLIYAGRS
jgi:dihydroxy-acid dehydratase